MNTFCDRCGIKGECPKGYTWTCGICSMRQSERINKKEEETLKECTPELIKKALKSKKLTYGSLAFKIHETANAIGQMARGEKIPSQALRSWVLDNTSEAPK